jgi:ABC-type transport system involved in multi-copper enzyme maturation permease subunit
MIEMIRRFLRQKFSNVGAVIALVAMAVLAGSQLAASGGQAGLEVGSLAVIVLAAACVSKDASGGALQMILCRPIRRSDYLLGRFCGILAAYGLFLLGAVGLALLFSRGIGPMLGAAAPPLALGVLARQLTGSLLGAIGMAAPILLLSTFLPGYGDVLGYILLTPLLAVPSFLAQILKAPDLEKIGDALRKNLLPSVEWSSVLSGGNPLGEATGRWVLAVVVYLVLALWSFSRREFAYGQD